MTDEQMKSNGSSAGTDDPIVRQVRAQRDAIAASVDYDLDALFERVKKHEELERSNGGALFFGTRVLHQTPLRERDTQFTVCN